jgi:hypothetical protein
VSDPIYWSEGKIFGFENMIDGQEDSCGEFLECGAAVYIEYNIENWYDPLPNTTDRHLWWIKPYDHKWYAIQLPYAVDNFIYQNGYLLLLIEGCVCNIGHIYFSWWNGKFWQFLLEAEGTTKFCANRIRFTHRPPQWIQLKQ